LANVQHNALTDPNIHEPKGVTTANAGAVYVATGTGSGNWSVYPSLDLFDGATVGQVFIADGAGSGAFDVIHKFIGANVPFNAASPYAYSHATTTSDTILNPVLSAAVNSGFTIATSPNARLVYADSVTIHAQITVSMSSQQASGTGRDVQWGLFKNGVEITGSRAIRTISTSDWGSITTTGLTQLVTGDYLELKTKADISATVNYASLNVTVLGVVI
tara:strand:- start:42 stop:695 length:654 start_codon:yes stop_codon:yes gene_type:complete